ncbi:hypothetical protein [Streptomyces sp. NPDC088554]|uniref:hypothetical protein n=1 Tax=Streptomyces sp. NPDC088554 TaxID=3365865 RepID=UPI00381BC718
MNRKALRIAALSNVVALTLGAAGSAASATAHEARTATAVQPTAVVTAMTASEARELLSIPEFRAELTAAEASQLQKSTEGQTVSDQGASSAARALVKLIKKYGPSLYNKAKDAAGSGLSSFKNWARSLSWYHPVRLAVLAAGDFVLSKVLDLIT